MATRQYYTFHSILPIPRPKYHLYPDEATRISFAVSILACYDQLQEVVMHLVTGGAGFIGSRVAQRLSQRGNDVIVLDDFNSGLYTESLKRDRVKELLEPCDIPVVELDIRDKGALDAFFHKYKIDKICHLAAWAGVKASIEKPEIYEAVNIVGSRHVFDMAVKHGIEHIVYASSSSVYGANTKQPFSEEDRVDQPVGPYALTKRVNELQAFCYHHLYQLKSTGLRFFTVYGPWGRPDMALFIFTKQILEGKPIKLNNFGNMKRDFTYIDDIVDGIIASLDTPFDYEVFNLGANQTVDLLDFVSMIETVTGKEAKRELLPMPPGEVEETSADVSKAQRMLNYHPKFTIKTGVPKFWEWYKDYYRI